MTYCLKPLYLFFLNFICSIIRLQCFRIVKFSRVENSGWPPLLKIAKLSKSSFPPERLGIFGWNFVWSTSGTLMLIDIKMKKICSWIRSQWPFENLRQPLNNLCRPGHLSPILQTGYAYLTEILYGVLVGSWCWLILKWKKNINRIRSQWLFENLRQQ